MFNPHWEKFLTFEEVQPNNAKWGPIGFQGAAKRDSDGIVYAWYGNDIVRVDTSTSYILNAPHFAGSIFSADRIDRMVFDNEGNLWIGTVNLIQMEP